MIMANYLKTVPYIMDFEGGLTDHPNDIGGITKYGVSLRFAKDTGDLELFDKDHDNDIDRNDIKLLSKEDAANAFKKYFWDKLKLDDISSEKKAFVVYDTAVNSGIGNAVPLMQRTLVKLGYHIDVDGKFGPKTFSAFQDADEDIFCEEFLELRTNFYYKIVERKPSQRVFIRGWLNRIKEIKNILKTY